jgi:hypothetical protein
VNRRRFLRSLSAAGATAFAATAVPRALGRQGQLVVHLVGMMGFVQRTDGSLLAVTPGHHPMQHFPHVPFAMARTGSHIAAALGMQPSPGVAPAAFDDRLADAGPDDFVFLCLEHSSVDVVAGNAPAAVDNRADWLAQFNAIAPGRRLRGDLTRWSHSTTLLQGGRLVNAVAHPDAGKIWTYGSHQQPLTDAVDFEAGAGSIRLAAGRSVRSFAPAPGESAEVWIVSSAGPTVFEANPKRLEHAVLFSHFLVGADLPVPECDTATGRSVVSTDLPCQAPSVASLDAVRAVAWPPVVDLCIQGYFNDGGGGF